MSRNLERSVARNLYAKFAKQWRHEQRLAGVYGKPNHFKRPKFNEWYAMHQKDLGMMQESAPNDVLEYVGEDPWGATSYAASAPETPGNETPNPLEQRGVVTLDIASGKEEEE